MTLLKRSDQEIKKDIVDQLYWDSSVDAADVEVEVSDNKVTLTGVVASYSGKLAAETDAANTPGVTSVINDLRIQYPPTVKIPTDTEIENNVVNLLIWSPNIDPTNIRVSVSRGVVTLEGSVDSYSQKIWAEELASDMTGVLKTVNKLAVTPSEDVFDESIAKAIVASIDRHPNIDAEAVNIEVRQGVVTLTGTVPSWTAYHDALGTARRTVGVVNVINNLSYGQNSQE